MLTSRYDTWTSFTARHDILNADTIEMMAGLAHCMIGKRLKYRDLITDNGLASGARGT